LLNHAHLHGSIAVALNARLLSMLFNDEFSELFEQMYCLAIEVL